MIRRNVEVRKICWFWEIAIAEMIARILIRVGKYFVLV